jgi:hypothetical protein
MIDKTLNTNTNTYVNILDEYLLEFDGVENIYFYARSCSLPQSSLQSYAIVYD